MSAASICTIYSAYNKFRLQWNFSHCSIIVFDTFFTSIIYFLSLSDNWFFQSYLHVIKKADKLNYFYLKVVHAYLRNQYKPQKSYDIFLAFIVCILTCIDTLGYINSIFRFVFCLFGTFLSLLFVIRIPNASAKKRHSSAASKTNGSLMKQQSQNLQLFFAAQTVSNWNVCVIIQPTPIMKLKI